MENYASKEEKLNIISHGLGFLLSVVGCTFLLLLALRNGDLRQVIGFGVFGMSLIILYAASTLYHSAKIPSIRNKLRIIDHASIYVLIAGSYTPFTLITMNGTTGELLFFISWGIALIGIIVKLFFTGRFKLISTAMYVLMGCIIFIDMNPLIDNMAIDGLYWLLVGGLSYIMGAIFYSIKAIKFNHAIFHVFVLIGSFCHYMAVYFYVV